MKGAAFQQTNLKRTFHDIQITLQAVLSYGCVSDQPVTNPGILVFKNATGKFCVNMAFFPNKFTGRGAQVKVKTCSGIEKQSH